MVKIRVHLKPGEDLGAFRSFKEQIAKKLEGSIMVLPMLDKGGSVTASSKGRKSDEEVLRAYASSLGVDRDVVKAGLRLMGKG